MLIRMKVETITEDEIFETPIIILKAIDSENYLPIWTGPFEGRAIEIGLENGQLFRPLPYDIIINILNELEVSLEKVVIYDYKDNIFYAHAHLNSGDSLMKIDTRPSDSIALAVRCGCPIFVEKNVLKDNCDEAEDNAENLNDINPKDFDAN